MTKIYVMPSETVIKSIRQDVFNFALDMSLVMDVKEKENGPKEHNFIGALQEIQTQMHRIEEQIENGGVSSDFSVIYRRLVHIANFAMIAHGQVKNQ